MLSIHSELAPKRTIERIAASTGMLAEGGEVGYNHTRDLIQATKLHSEISIQN